MRIPEGPTRTLQNDVLPIRDTLLGILNKNDLAARRGKRLGGDLLGVCLGDRVHSARDRIASGILDLRHHLRILVIEHLIGSKRFDELEVARRRSCDDLVTGRVRELYETLAHGS